MLLSQYYLVWIDSNNFISNSYRKFLFNLITSFKFNWCVLLLRKTISRQRNPLIVFCRMMQVPVYSLCRPLLKLNSAKTHGTDYSSKSKEEIKKFQRERVSKQLIYISIRAFSKIRILSWETGYLASISTTSSPLETKSSDHFLKISINQDSWQNFMTILLHLWK